MRKVLMALGMLVALGCEASASDRPGYDGGLYAGLSVGYSASVLEAEDIDLAGQGAFVGAFAGFGGVTNGVYMGVEGDFQISDVTAGFSDADVSVRGSSDYLASIRARVGLPLGPALLYATAGPAVTKSKITATDGVDTISDGKLSVGLAVGAGIEAELTPTVLVRVEGLHYRFPSETYDMDGSSVRVDQSETVIRAGVAFKLY